MKNLLTSFFLFFSLAASAQGGAFYADKWKVLRHVQTYKDKQMSLYHRDSTRNLLEYAQYSIKFAPDFTYLGTNERGTSIKGTWALNATKDTMSIDGHVYKLQVLNANYLTLRTFSREMVDTLGTLDTVYTDMTFYSLPDLTTSAFENAFGSEYIKVFPNPVKQKVDIQAGGTYKESIGKIVLSSCTGQVLKTMVCDPSAPVHTLDMQEFHTGIYLLEIIRQDGSRVTVKKMVKE